MTTAPATSAFPEPGDSLGPFRVVRRLGLGGMGIVLEAVDTALGRSVALKVITPHIAEDDGFRARFTREAQAQASLDSPHVVQVYAFGEADGRLYIASQLIPGGDLGHRLTRQGPLAPRAALDLIAQVADGLADAHAAGLVHRDIKPANVLLRERDGVLQAYLADFGIARMAADDTGRTRLTVSGGTLGTPTYMAPELHTGGRAGTSSDVYALGCLLWATLTGAPPYVAASDYLVVRAHLEAPVPQVAPDGALAVEVNRVLRTAMAKQPHERYPTAVALRDDLRSVLARSDGDAQLSVPTGALAELPPPTRRVGDTPVPVRGRRRWPFVVAAAVVLAVVVAAAAVVGVVLASRGGPASTSREDTAKAAIAAGYSDPSGVVRATPDQARCLASTMVDGLGVDAIVDSGILDDQLGFHVVSIAGDPPVFAAFQGALITCRVAG